MEWAFIHKEALMENWLLMAADLSLKKIEPLK
jgi:hypothetical protein